MNYLKIQVRTYHNKVIEHFSRRENVGFLDKPNHVGIVGVPASADILRSQIQVDLGTGKLTDITTLSNNETSVINNTMYLSKTLRGLSVNDQMPETNKDDAPFPPAKLHCSVTEDSIQSAINSYFATRHG
ncbi:hypothetical protein INT45_013693 [Circinella minor]|uniref:NIF system FeS cluster assembly NifU N-terminal domain-containing protein n=1 Tax=Circinella minor TaxID=1195481 RepID=A0A8H7SC81_9FUNG|nr:hypothetical protein INT45_013693 [Circinella minor]